MNSAPKTAPATPLAIRIACHPLREVRQHAIGTGLRIQAWQQTDID